MLESHQDYLYRAIRSGSARTVEWGPCLLWQNRHCRADICRAKTSFQPARPKSNATPSQLSNPPRPILDCTLGVKIQQTDEEAPIVEEAANESQIPFAHARPVASRSVGYDCCPRRRRRATCGRSAGPAGDRHRQWRLPERPPGTPRQRGQRCEAPGGDTEAPQLRRHRWHRSHRRGLRQALPRRRGQAPRGRARS